MVGYIISNIISILFFCGGLIALLQVKTDVGTLCAAILMVCAWIVSQLAEIVRNTRPR